MPKDPTPIAPTNSTLLLDQPDAAPPTDGNASIEGKAIANGKSYTPHATGKADKNRALKFPRRFTTAGQDPFESVEWEKRTAAITGEDGKLVFEQKDAEIPKSWSQLATNVVVSKYFRGALDSPQRETSVRQVIGRVADTIGKWGRDGNYFASEEDASAFRDELTYLLLHQYGSFNSPVWFNIGVKGAKQQASACQPYDALVSTPSGLIPIGDLVEKNAVGTQVFDANGAARIVATKANGVKNVLRIHTKAGYTLDVTADHLVWKSTGQTCGKWVEAGTLQVNDVLNLHRTPSGEKTERQHNDREGSYLWASLNAFDWELPQNVFAALCWAPLATVASYLRQRIFQLQQSVEVQPHQIVWEQLSAQHSKNYQQLLLRLGIFSCLVETESNTFNLIISGFHNLELFQQEIGFIHSKSCVSLELLLQKANVQDQSIVPLQIERIENRGEMPVFDIQTTSGEYLSGNIRVHNCFINRVYDDMESIMELAATEARLFKGGSGAGVNLWRIRSSKEQLSGGGVASGPVSFMRGWDAFAGAIKCLTPDAYVYTDEGMKSVGEIIAPNLEAGFHADESVVLATKDGAARISQVYVSPEAPTFKMQLSHTGLQLRGTGQHPVLTLAPGFRLEWKSLNNLKPGDRVAVSRSSQLWPETAPDFSDFAPNLTWAKIHLDYPTQLTPELARLLGYMVSEGCMDKDRFRFCNADEDVFSDFLHCVQSVFGVDPRPNVGSRVNEKTGVKTYQFEACWTNAVRFLQHVGLGFELSRDKKMPHSIRRAPRALAVEFLRAYFEGDGHVSTHVYAASASRGLLSEIQLMLLNMGMLPLLRFHPVVGKDYWSLYLRGEEAWKFVREIGFISARKQAAADLAGDKNTNIDTIPFLVDALRERTSKNGYFRCADGTTKTLGFGFFNRKPGSAISYGRLRNTPALLDQLEQIEPAWAQTLEFLLEREFFWDSVLSVEEAEPAITYDFTVPETHSFVANGIVNHNSGGTTRRAAKMVILNAEHPDIEEFITCKAEEEKKAWALIDAGYNGGFNVPGGAYDSVDFQNANHSVRVTDEFMRAAENDAPWTTRAVLTGKPIEKKSARALLHKIAETTHICGDPGLQYDTTINDWHTSANTDRIYASNPCSEFLFLDSTACNLASLNLMKFRSEDGQFDAETFVHACETFITAQEILVSNASYPTEEIARNSEDYRPLGLGYANLGALLMAQGTAYDSDEGRALAGAITAIMTGSAYAQSARISANTGPFNGYDKNREPMLRVIGKHRDAVNQIDSTLVPPTVLNSARKVWDDALVTGQKHGYRNAQATVLAPTGCLVGGSLVATDRGLVRLKKLGDPNGATWQDVDFAVHTDEGTKRATKFFINGVAPTRKIRTAAGYEIQGTLKHRVKVVDPKTGQWNWKRFADVAAGDIVPLAMNSLVGEAREVALPPLGEMHRTGDYSTRVPRLVSPELAEFVGYFMGDGSLHAKGLRFCVANGDEDVAARLTELGRELFGLEAHQTPQQGYLELAFHSVPLTTWWEACGFAKTAPKENHSGKGWAPHIPDAILHSNNRAVYAAFLRGLFEADGTLTEGVPSVCSANADFANEVRSLLLALGFPTSSKVGENKLGTQHSALSTASYNPRFRAEIGFMGARKQSGIIELKGALSGKRDRVFVAPALLNELAPAGHPLRDAIQISLRRHGAIARQLATELFHLTGDERLKPVLDFFFDEVQLNEDGGEQMTFDLSVPANVTYTANGFVSHNTIAFMMDCDTTGIEPDIALVKYKKLVGGGLLKIVNQTVPEALAKLGYSADEIKGIVDYIDKNDTIEGAPGLRDDDLKVFDCAFKPMNGTRSIHHMGHIKMMSAAQPFISGAISKTCNMPQECTVDEIMDAYLQAWKLGIKAVAIYRDGSKRTQPLSTASDAQKAEKKEADVRRAFRRKLPDERMSITHKFSIAGQEGYFMVGLYQDGSPGEIFIKMSKEGSTISGLMDSFAVAVSMCLQYGVPLRVLVNKFSHSRFEPAGYTTNKDIPIAKSLMDYIFRWFDLKFHPNGTNGSLHHAAEPVLELEEAKPADPVRMVHAGAPESNANGTHAGDAQRSLAHMQSDAPPCSDCGTIMVRSGACYRCPDCGATSGCG